MSSDYDQNIFSQVESLGIKYVPRCYQCLKCTTGCPVIFAMDYTPTQVIRMVTMGLKKELLECGTIWVCASCETCTTRCPMEIDIAGVMDVLREIALKENAPIKDPKTSIFNKIFLDVVKTRGRLYELLLIGHYKYKTKTFMQDMDIGKQMFLKGKLKLFERKIKGTKEIKKMFHLE